MSRILHGISGIFANNDNRYLKPEQLWIDPDCGLKTRQWAETKAALTNMVDAAKVFRERYAARAA